MEWNTSHKHVVQVSEWVSVLVGKNDLQCWGMCYALSRCIVTNYVCYIQVVVENDAHVQHGSCCSSSEWARVGLSLRLYTDKIFISYNCRAPASEMGKKYISTSSLALNKTLSSTGLWEKCVANPLQVFAYADHTMTPKHTQNSREDWSTNWVIPCKYVCVCNPSS